MWREFETDWEVVRGSSGGRDARKAYDVTRGSGWWNLICVASLVGMVYCTVLYDAGVTWGV